MNSTKTDLKALRDLAASIETDDALCGSFLEASRVLEHGILGLLKRDAFHAAAKAGQEAPFIKAWSKQADWRDLAGFLCGSERTAQFVAAWAAKYLDCTDGDGNSAEPRIDEIDGQWVVVTRIVKID